MLFTRRALLMAGPILTAEPILGVEPTIPVLIMDGMNNHDWQAGTHGISRILNATGRFSVGVVSFPMVLPPDFNQFKVVINNFNGGHKEDGVRWPPEVEKALEKFLENGGGLVNFHAANNAFLKWEAYNEIIGLGWRDKSFGPELVIDEQERVKVIPAGEGLAPGHGPRHDFRMTTLDTEHPMTKGFPKHWMHPSEQLTHGQHAVANPKRGAAQDALHILTYAASKDSHRNEPMDWVRRWGKGRVYTTMLGHTWKNEKNPNLRCVGFETLLARGAEWAATGRVTLAAPKQFPTPDKILLSGDVE